MQLGCEVNGYFGTIKGDDVNAIANAFAQVKAVATSKGNPMRAVSWLLDGEEYERFNELPISNNLKPLLSLPMFVTAHPEEPLAMPALFDDVPVANYQGAGGYSHQNVERLPVGPALPLPKLFS